MKTVITAVIDPTTGINHVNEADIKDIVADFRASGNILTSGTVLVKRGASPSLDLEFRYNHQRWVRMENGSHFIELVVETV